MAKINRLSRVIFNIFNWQYRVKLKWYDEDVDKIVTMFTQELGSLKKLPSRSQVRVIFEEHLADILQQKAYQRCYNKIKHLVDLNKKKKK